MNQIDHSIYFQAKGPDFVQAISDGMGMRQQWDKQQQQKQDQSKKKAMDDAYRSSFTKNPDGTMSFDKGVALSKLAGTEGAGQETFQAQQQFQAQDQANQKAAMQKKLDELNMQGQLLGNVKDQASWTSAKQQASQMGMDVSKLPDFYDPGITRQMQYQTLTAKEQLNFQLERERLASAAADRAENNSFRREELGLKRAEAERKLGNGDNMPLDQRKMVETLSTKNAGKLAIKNQIDSVMAGWDNLSDDQKVASGRSLLKTLNSTEGADAIGVEEAKRLGSKLEIAMGNFTNSNPTQWGRDLEGFKTQPENASAGIGGAIKRNQSEVDRLMGRPTDPIRKKAPLAEYQTYKTNQIDWMD